MSSMQQRTVRKTVKWYIFIVLLMVAILLLAAAGSWWYRGHTINRIAHDYVDQINQWLEREGYDDIARINQIQSSDHWQKQVVTVLGQIGVDTSPEEFEAVIDVNFGPVPLYGGLQSLQATVSWLNDSKPVTILSCKMTPKIRETHFNCQSEPMSYRLEDGLPFIVTIDPTRHQMRYIHATGQIIGSTEIPLAEFSVPSLYQISVQRMSQVFQFSVINTGSFEQKIQQALSGMINGTNEVSVESIQINQHHLHQISWQSEQQITQGLASLTQRFTLAKLDPAMMCTDSLDLKVNINQLNLAVIQDFQQQVQSLSDPDDVQILLPLYRQVLQELAKDEPALDVHLFLSAKQRELAKAKLHYHYLASSDNTAQVDPDQSQTDDEEQAMQQALSSSSILDLESSRADLKVTLQPELLNCPDAARFTTLLSQGVEMGYITVDTAGQHSLDFVFNGETGTLNQLDVTPFIINFFAMMQVMLATQ